MLEFQPNFKRTRSNRFILQNINIKEFLKYFNSLDNISQEMENTLKEILAGKLLIKDLEKLPEFTKMATEMVTILKKLCNKVLDDDKHSTDQSIEAYKTIISDVYKPILDELTVIIERDDLSVDDKKYFADKMVEIASKTEAVADKISQKDTDGKDFKLKVLNTLNNTIGGVLVGTLTIGAIILGAKYIETNGKKFLK